MKAPRKFFEPLAIGAPSPYRELPMRLERMIHFVPPHNEKLRAKADELATQVDVILGNLEESELTPEGNVRPQTRQRGKLQNLAPPPQMDLFGS